MFEERRVVIVLLGALRVVMLEGELVVLNVADIAGIERARLLIHGILQLLQRIEGIERDARELEDAWGVLGPYGLELGHERGLVLCRQGGRGRLAPLDEERPARRAWGDGGGWGRWRCLHRAAALLVLILAWTAAALMVIRSRC